MTGRRRSCLVLPAGRPRMAEHAAAAGADQVIFDLEDAVPAAGKADARHAAVRALADHDYRDAVVSVRVNATDTHWQHQDVAELVADAPRLDSVVLPKVEHPGQLWYAAHLLDHLEAIAGRTRPITLEVLVESPAGVLRLGELCAATDRVRALVFGPGDYAAATGAPHLDVGVSAADDFLPVRTALLQHARAAGLHAIDGPYGDITNPAGFRASALAARRLGMDGKWCVHPSQVPIANEVFTPSADEVRAARRLLAGYADAVRDGRAATTVNGTLVDEASRRMAERLLSRALDPDELSDQEDNR